MMSYVIESKKVGAAIWTTFNYAGNFLEMIRKHRTKQAIVDPFNLNMEAILEEEFMLLENWWQQTGTRWSRPGTRYHIFIGDERAQIAKDWPPPAVWAEVSKVIASLALPQYPQTRVLIPDKTDWNNKKRSIRVHPAEKIPPGKEGHVRGPI